MQLSPDVSQVLAGLMKRAAGVRQDRKIWGLSLDAFAAHYDASAGTVLLYRRREDDLHKVRSVGKPEPWNQRLLLDFFHNRKPELAATLVMAPVREGDRVVGVLALRRDDPFRRGAGREMTEVLKVLGRWIGCRRDLTIRSAECAIGRAILGNVGARDVTYRILHQFRRFIDYNHGSSVLGFVGGETARVLARQVAWTDGKSDLVGETIAIDSGDIPPGPGGSILTEGFARLWDTLEALREEGSPPKKSIMVGRLVDDEGEVGLVEVSSTTPCFFMDSDLGILSRFLPYLAWCVRRLKDVPENTGGSHG